MLRSFDFEITGTVQRVFFRKCTKEQADSLNIVGWVKNTPEGTVVGQAEGQEDKMKLFKHWLSNVGSPQSKIANARFYNETVINELKHSQFEIIRRKP